MRIRTIAANILLPSGIALAVAVSWFWATGDFHPPVRTVVGLALLSAGLAAGADWAGQQVVYALRRRGRPSRHRKAAPSRPLTDRANPMTTTPEGKEKHERDDRPYPSAALGGRRPAPRPWL